jgi:hypothetical protein
MGIIHARPFDDPRNTVVVDNNDPNAADKSHAGIPGTHTEQRCCGNKPPSRLPEMTGWYVDEKGLRIVQIIAYWSRPENRAGAKDGWWNAETPHGYYVEMANTGVLTCDGCFGSAWDQFLDDLSTTFTEMVPVIRGIAMAVSYIPVFGTAVSFLINASVSLAQGASVDSAFLDGVAGALPGQPASGAAFNATRALMRGDRIDHVAIAALPVDQSIKDVVAAVIDIAVAVTRGEKLTNIALDQLYARLPSDGKRAMDIARKVVNGENVAGVVVNDAMRAAADAAKAQGEDAVNRYVAEAGFESAIDTLAPELQAALRAGVVAGHSERHQLIGTFDSSEKNVASNDAYAIKGQQIIASGAMYGSRRLSDIRNSKRFTFTHDAFDALTGTVQRRTDVYDITDPWRRGFDVAIGLCEGMSQDGPGQQRVRMSLGTLPPQRGFDAGQAIQFQRTRGRWRVSPLTNHVNPGVAALNRQTTTAPTPHVDLHASPHAFAHAAAPSIVSAGALKKRPLSQSTDKALSGLKSQHGTAFRAAGVRYTNGSFR